MTNVTPAVTVIPSALIHPGGAEAVLRSGSTHVARPTNVTPSNSTKFVGTGCAMLPARSTSGEIVSLVRRSPDALLKVLLMMTGRWTSSTSTPMPLNTLPSTRANGAGPPDWLIERAAIGGTATPGWTPGGLKVELARLSAGASISPWSNLTPVKLTVPGPSIVIPRSFLPCIQMSPGTAATACTVASVPRTTREPCAVTTSTGPRLSSIVNVAPSAILTSPSHSVYGLPKAVQWRFVTLPHTAVATAVAFPAVNRTSGTTIPTVNARSAQSARSHRTAFFLSMNNPLW